MPLLKLTQIKKTFQRNKKTVGALQGADVAVKRGSIVGIIGLSGAGKSTLLRCMNRLETPDSGSILFHGQDLMAASKEELRQIRMRIGMIFQHFNLLSRRTALENVLLPLEIKGVSRGAALKKAKACLKQVGLEDMESAYPRQLSGGQKQRVAIARALASDVEVLLCDEATSALDSKTTSDILHLLKDLNTRLGLTIVLITHEIKVVKMICDDVYVMDSGQVVESGPVEDLFANPQHELSKSLTYSVFHPDLPDFIQKQLSETAQGSCQAVLRLLFTEGSADKPVISHLIKESSTEVNILSGYLDHIGKKMFGSLIVTVAYTPDALEKAITFLKQEGIGVEHLGFIPTRDIHD